MFYIVVPGHQTYVEQWPFGRFFRWFWTIILLPFGVEGHILLTLNPKNLNLNPMYLLLYPYITPIIL